jgi:hypothetical protein
MKWRYFVNIRFRTVDASGFVDLSHAINVRFTSVISVYAHLSPF